MKLEWLKKIQKLIPLRQIPYSNYILLAILILGFIIRVYKINSLPLYGDELTIVYDSYSILKTGMDQTGQFLPLTFKMGAGRPAGYVYGSIPVYSYFWTYCLGSQGFITSIWTGNNYFDVFFGKEVV